LFYSLTILPTKDTIYTILGEYYHKFDLNERGTVSLEEIYQKSEGSTPLKGSYSKCYGRQNSFLGIHFDFHATANDMTIGENTTEKMIEAVICSIKPDYIQIDSKGHPGLSSYPTKIGYPAPGIVLDQLKLWRKVTKKYGIALYGHFSGIMDEKAIQMYPEWASVQENGEISTKNTSVFSPYADELLIPQLKELCDDYNMDGIWVDGDCWAANHDYHQDALRKFQAATGITSTPRTPEDPYFYEFTTFCRNAFKRYLKKYVDELHTHNPEFQICSNWAFSSYMPEEVDINVDFLSGDFSLQNSVNCARLQGRCFASQGVPWDLMAWSFSGVMADEFFTQKSKTQLKQEAAVVISLGGGFQGYFRQKRDGSVMQWQIDVMSDVAKFCRERQLFCHKAKSVPQVGFYFAREPFYRRMKTLFRPWYGELASLEGTIRLLLETQHHIDVVMDHHLERCHTYPLIVVPEWDYIEEKYKNLLLNYVKNGGNLLLIGPLTAKIFEKELNVELIAHPEEKIRWLHHNGFLGIIKTLMQSVKLKKNAVPFGKIYRSEDIDDDFDIPATISPYGKGKIGCLYCNIGESYCHTVTTVTRDFVDSMIRELFPEPMVEVEGSKYVDLVINQINGKLAINLINISGLHANKNVYVFDEIPFLGPLEITIRLEKKPEKITLQPENELLEFKFEKGCAVVTVPKLLIHNILIVE